MQNLNELQDKVTRRPRIYFAAPIRGDQSHKENVLNILNWLTTKYEVLTEHIGTGETLTNDQDIWTRDIKWIMQADAVIAEVSAPSLGVGYEIAYARYVLQKNVLCIAHVDAKVSAMLTGDITLEQVRYTSWEFVQKPIENFMFLDTMMPLTRSGKD